MRSTPGAAAPLHRPKVGPERRPQPACLQARAKLTCGTEWYPSPPFGHGPPELRILPSTEEVVQPQVLRRLEILVPHLWRKQNRTGHTQQPFYGLENIKLLFPEH
ncbi:hypothetical protein NDU88_000067 [Pleurodeles waltl]|uniref:Uncharacterized protein n=1 Tax=Pleurodeles waltl TaxID=8319 RepID=A0AAV7S8H4_PLEWA|nr:hypothetical protein NDU88_000067 [Pleurodeles waltl]